MNLSQLSLKEFLCEDSNEVTPEPADLFDGISKSIRMGKILSQDQNGYSICEIKDNSNSVVLLHNGIIVGFYLGESLMMKKEYKGKCLSVPLVLNAVKNRPLPKKRILSEGGKAALTCAWQVANGKRPNLWPKLS